VDSLVLGWNFLTQVGTEIKCAGHEVIIPAKNCHKGRSEERVDFKGGKRVTYVRFIL